MNLRNNDRLLMLLLSVAILLSIVPPFPAYAAESLRYTALGDSVPAGYAPDPAPGNRIPSYVDVFTNMLEETGFIVDKVNIAVDGQTSTGLLTSLLAQGADLSGLRDADLVTINIGGNNVLGPTISIISEIAASVGISDFMTATTMQLLSLVGALSTFTPSDLQKAALQAGVDAFASDFPDIIGLVREIAPNALIMVSSIYNPVPGELAVFHNLAATYIPAMNDIIMSGNGYTVVDVYSAFLAAPQGVSYTNVNLSPTAPSVDIHPNAAGHELIAKLHYAVFNGDDPTTVVPGLNPDPKPNPGDNAPFFSDTEGGWMDEAVRYMAAMGIINGIGDNLFAPDRNVTRAEFLTITVNALCAGSLQIDLADVGQFSDVPAGVFYYDSALTARALGVVTGVGGNRFDPEVTITRQDMFTLLHKTMAALDILWGVEKPEGFNVVDSFHDWGQVAGYARESTEYFILLELISGKDGRLDPLGTATRAEAAQILFNIIAPKG